MYFTTKRGSAMGAKFRSWWRKVRKPQEIAPIAALLIGLVAVIFLVIAGYNFHWDWLQLLVIPFVLAVGSYLFIYTASRNGQKAMQLRNQTERDIALDNQHETALQDYIDKLSELLLHEKLRESAPEDEVRKIARVRTLTVLPRLDKERKRSVLQFLHESGLIDRDKGIIDLRGADLSGANLIAAYLNEADLSRAILSEADLSGAYLDEANLGGAYLRGAILRGSYLHGANLSGANLSGANLDEAYLGEANLGETDLSGAILSGANLHGAGLGGANLGKANLSGANLSGFNLGGANLGGANLGKANLSRAILSGADLHGADLFGADLHGADLSGADLSEADLNEADLNEAYLNGATITPEQLDKAKSLTGAVMPDGLKHP
jgi:uncharacterized protein YjbI with pentapeptide repeats